MSARDLTPEDRPDACPTFLLALKDFAITLVVGAIGAWFGYLGSQQPKVWFDRQWAGMALYKGGYRSWTLSFCDGFTVAPGTYTNGIVKMVPVTIDTKSGKMRYGYHWPTYAHTDIRRLITEQGEIRPGVKVDYGLVTNSTSAWPVNLSGMSNITIQLTNTGGDIQFTNTGVPHDLDPQADQTALEWDKKTGHLWKFEGGKWIDIPPDISPADP